MNGKTLEDHHVGSREILRLHHGKQIASMFSCKGMTTISGINGGTEADGANGKTSELQEEV